MTRLAAAFLLMAAPALADPIPLPSGLEAELLDVRHEAQPHSDEAWLILRLLAPELGGDAEAALTDLDWLCTAIGLRARDQLDDTINVIVVTLMDRPVAWGEADPEAIQYVSSYLVEDEGCAPDLF